MVTVIQIVYRAHSPEILGLILTSNNSHCTTSIGLLKGDIGADRFRPNILIFVRKAYKN